MIDFTNEANLYSEREIFLQSLTEKKLTGDKLIKKLLIRPDLHKLLRNSCYNYLVSSLIHNELQFKNIENYDDFIVENARQIKKMKNITPNGVIKPKYEIASEFNQIQKSLNLILEDIGIYKNVAKIRAPISIRIVTSDDDESIKQRPRANNRLHSDFWTGSVCDFAALIPIFGTLENVDVVFCEPIGIKKNYLQEFPNYADGESTYEAFKEYKTVMEHGNLYLQDIFCLHGTRRRGIGARISIDFTFQSKEYEKGIKKYYSNYAKDNDNHITTEKWRKLGYDLFLSESEKINDPIRIKEYEKLSNVAFKGSAIELQTSNTAKLINVFKVSEIT
jgi:hypothetical protein